MAKMGRKRKEVDMEQLGALCRMKPTLADCAAFFKCSEDTIENRIKEHANCRFSEFREQNMVHTRFDLIRSAIAKAERSDTMHIFCLKNLCDWSDKKSGDDATVVVNKYEKMSDEELDAEIVRHLKTAKESSSSGQARQ